MAQTLVQLCAPSLPVRTSPSGQLPVLFLLHALDLQYITLDVSRDPLGLPLAYDTNGFGIGPIQTYQPGETVVVHGPKKELDPLTHEHQRVRQRLDQLIHLRIDQLILDVQHLKNNLYKSPTTSKKHPESHNNTSWWTNLFQRSNSTPTD